jgi:hypothetical protein
VEKAKCNNDNRFHFKLPPDEAKKRQERRERNKEAAARCRRRREDLTVTLTHVIFKRIFFCRKLNQSINQSITNFTLELESSYYLQ